MKKIITLLTISILLIGCTNKEEEITKNIFAMDTYIQVKLYKNTNTNKDILENINNMYLEYDKLCDMYNQYDNVVNVYYLNEILENDKEITIDKKLSELIKYSLESYNKTDGYFNPAIGNITLMWHNYLQNSKVPKEEELSNSGSTNIEDIILTDTTYKKKNNVKLDLGGICKGYTTQVAGDYLELLGIKSYLINAGGNVKVGSHYNNDKYTIGIQDPSTNDILTKVYGENISVVTSGDYQRYYEVEGIKYNHIINPKTNTPSNQNTSVTIITPSSSYGDIMSTYLFMQDKDTILKIVDNTPDIEAIIVDKKGNITKSKGFTNYEEK